MKKQRNLDGYYYRVKRDDRWQSVCLSDMSDAELCEVLRFLRRKDLEAIVRGLANRLYQVGERFGGSL